MRRAGPQRVGAGSGRLAFDGGGRPGPQVAGRGDHPHPAQVLAIAVVRGIDLAAEDPRLVSREHAAGEQLAAHLALGLRLAAAEQQHQCDHQGAALQRAARVVDAVALAEAEHQVARDPELVGRLPVVGTLHELDKPALVQILTQPRNAITRQYQKLFEYENVKLRFSDDALEAIAESALERKIGARGLRMIIEDLMLDLMYSLPNQKKIRECVITREVVEAKDKPITLIEKAG